MPPEMTWDMTKGTAITALRVVPAQVLHYVIFSVRYALVTYWQVLKDEQSVRQLS